MKFLKQIQSKLGEHEPHEVKFYIIQVDELILDDLFENIENFTEDHKKTLELYDSLEYLSLNGMGLKTLQNFPELPNLQKVLDK